MQNNKIVEVNNLTCAFNKKTKQEIKALDNISSSYEQNKIHFIIGNSGSGKTTLVLHFNGLLKSKKSLLNIDDFKIVGSKYKIRKIKELRKKISIVFQFPEYQLFKDTVKSDMSFSLKSLKVINDEFNKINYKNLINYVNDNYKEIEYLSNNEYLLKNIEKNITSIKFKNNHTKIKINNKWLNIDYVKIPKNQIQDDICKNYLNIVDLDQSFLEKNPFELSGGEKRKVAIAGILAINSNILVFDEPTSNVDPHGRREIINLIKNLKEKGKTIFIISHNMDEVLEIGDSVTILDKGKIIKKGVPFEIFKDNEIFLNTNLVKPKIIDMINELENRNKKFSKLWDFKPINVEKLSYAINQIINDKRS